MQLKRLYDKTNPKAPVVNGVMILRASDEQHFSTDFVANGEAQGWVARDGDRLIIINSGKGGNATYSIKRAPGYYCCHCKMPMADGAAARAHLALAHAGKKSPDASNPSGYERINYFDCVKE